MYTTVKSCVRFESTYSSFFDSYSGLKPGNPSSPLLFMLFVNDIISSINKNLWNIFTLNEIKLFLILYADDQVVFAKSPETLQFLLYDIEDNCNSWGLKINTAKAKMMIFEKGRQTNYDCFINNTRIISIELFRYLGVTIFKNGNWHRSQKCIAKHASIALYNLFAVLNNIELSVNQTSWLNFKFRIGNLGDAWHVWQRSHSYQIPETHC